MDRGSLKSKKSGFLSLIAALRNFVRVNNFEIDDDTAIAADLRRASERGRW